MHCRESRRRLLIARVTVQQIHKSTSMRTVPLGVQETTSTPSGVQAGCPATHQLLSRRGDFSLLPVAHATTQQIHETPLARLGFRGASEVTSFWEEGAIRLSENMSLRGESIEDSSRTWDHSADSRTSRQRRLPSGG